MEGKIKFRFLFIGFFSILLTTVLITLIFYQLFQTQVREELQNTASILAYDEKLLSDPDHLDGYERERFRITLISSDGWVLYENRADENNMENHLTRPEIQEALSQGKGEDVRRSSTLGYDAYYYALRLENGSVLRMAMETRNVYSMFQRAVPAVCFVGFLILLLSVALSSMLTKQLIRPIEIMAQHLDVMEEDPPYKELVPFVQTIREQQKRKNEITQMRQEFTANVSHELKTPLTSISGYAEMIETGLAKAEDVPVFAEKIHGESQRMLALIGDIMKLSELDEGKKELFFEAVDLSQLVLEVQSRLQLQAQRARVTVLTDGSSAVVNGNRKLLEELVFNLCDNAIRYNRPGGTVMMKTNETKDAMILTVSDTGIGIEPDQQNRVFERFYRVDKSRSKNTGGTGLGLAIVKHIAIQHHAQLHLVSTPGQGTRITVVFPLTDGRTKQKV